ncbi:MAG: hypothetical protein LBG97_07240 [Coriobacteriales bacterium]|jgi:hypothetical protein|nr:hypothetical protein [Coriobacteriales bacterium]
MPDPLFVEIVLVGVLMVALIAGVIMCRDKAQKIAIAAAFGSLIVLGILFYLVVVVLSRGDLFILFVFICLAVPIGLYFGIMYFASRKAIAAEKEIAAAFGASADKPKASTANLGKSSTDKRPLNKAIADKRLADPKATDTKRTTETEEVSKKPIADNNVEKENVLSAAPTSSASIPPITLPSTTTGLRFTSDKRTDDFAKTDNLAREDSGFASSDAEKTGELPVIDDSFAKPLAPIEPSPWTSYKATDETASDETTEQTLQASSQPEQLASPAFTPAHELPEPEDNAKEEPVAEHAPEQSEPADGSKEFKAHYAKAEAFRNKNMHLLAAQLFEKSALLTSDLNLIHKAIFCAMNSYLKVDMRDDVLRLAQILKNSGTTNPAQSAKLSAFLKMMEKSNV